MTDIAWETYNTCGKMNPASCGNMNVALTNTTISDMRNVTLMYSEGCSYKLTSQCGFPNVTMNTSNADVSIVFFNNITTTQVDPPMNYTFLTNETITFTPDAMSNAMFSYRFPGWDDNSYMTCAVPRYIYFTVTNTIMPAMSPMLAEGRLMQAVNLS